MDESDSEPRTTNKLLFTQSAGGNWEVCNKQSPPVPSIALRNPTKLFRKNREKMMAISSSSLSPPRLASRPTRLRRLASTKQSPPQGAGKSSENSGTNRGASGSKVKKKPVKEPPPPLTPTQIMVRRMYESINRAYKQSLRESVKQVWNENSETLHGFLRKHEHMQSAMATSSILLSQKIVTSKDIQEATLQLAEQTATTGEKIKVIVMPENPASKGAEKQCQVIPVTTISHVSEIPPVLDWTAIPHNLHEDDGKFLTNIPFLGDEFIDKDAKFIDEMVTLYEGKVHEAKDSSSYRKMDDEVLYNLVQAMIRIEADEGPNVFVDQPQTLQPEETCENVEVGDDESPPVLEIEGVVEDKEKSTTFSDVAAKLFAPEVPASTPDLMENISCEETVTDKGEVSEVVETEKPEEEKSAIVQKMDVDLTELEVAIEQRKQSEAFAEDMDNATFNLPVSTEVSGNPSDTIFSVLSSTFKGLGSPSEIRERYQNAEKARNKPTLPILPNGMEHQPAESYSIPNIEGPYAKYLPKEATMHAYQILFCRRCFVYDCKRHTGDDQVDVKYHKNGQSTLLQSSSTSAVSSASNNAFNFLCKNPDCWQMNDVVAKPHESILSEWSPSDRSIFSCFIDSFPSNYCFIAYLMQNKSCAQVKEYADLEHIPKMESCSDDSSSRAKSKHRKTRMGVHKKSSGHSNSKRNLTRRWINNVKKTEKSRDESGMKSVGLKLPPRYLPCLHENGGECDATCTCRINKTSCEKFCTCALTCPYRFPGCKCLSTCDSKRCICFAAARECDPDLCIGCGAHEHNVEKISCHNVNIQRKLHKHLLMGRSDISGWGIYIKSDAQKGEFIAEYRGELISHDESERRGHVYDKIQHTFLFELNDHFVVDATRKGNKARFVNSSKNPNCEVKRMFVNGDHRIGIYAKRYIEAGEELFYDYEDVLEKQQKAAEGAAAKNSNRGRRE